MKQKTTIETLVNYAVRLGHNADHVREIIEENFDYIMRVYPNASKREKIHIAFVIYKGYPKKTMREVFHALCRELGETEGKATFEWYCRVYGVTIADNAPARISSEIFGE